MIAVDTGHGQIDFRLRQDSRVHLLEKTNARYLTREQVGEVVDFVAMDVSFISATLVLPAVIAAAFPASPAERQGPADDCTGEAAIRGGPRKSREGRHRAGRGHHRWLQWRRCASLWWHRAAHART